jgi:hypothetical protein
VLCVAQELLEKKIAEKGLDPDSLKFYIDSFRHGICPHGGGGIGNNDSGACEYTEEFANFLIF